MSRDRAASLQAKWERAVERAKAWESDA
jgi:hypothetical protein